jgi:membrane fusion protein (multidrug efflux system)
VDAYPKIKWFGIVESLSPMSGAKLSLLPAENASGNFTKIVQRFPVRIKIQKASVDHPPLLRAGMSVAATVYVKSKKGEYESSSIGKR